MYMLMDHARQCKCNFQSESGLAGWPLNRRTDRIVSYRILRAGVEPTLDPYAEAFL